MFAYCPTFPIAKVAHQSRFLRGGPDLSDYNMCRGAGVAPLSQPGSVVEAPHSLRRHYAGKNALGAVMRTAYSYIPGVFFALAQCMYCVLSTMFAALPICSLFIF